MPDCVHPAGVFFKGSDHLAEAGEPVCVAGKVRERRACREWIKGNEGEGSPQLCRVLWVSTVRGGCPVIRDLRLRKSWP